MNSDAANSEKKKGGILRSRKRPSGLAPGRVTFSAPSPRALSDGAADCGYESDDVVLASGEATSLGRHRHRDGGMDDGDGDAAVRTAAEIDEARRSRGRARRREGEHTAGDADVDASEDDLCMSLITDRGADPDAYESNAVEHAACPVEPFNMEAEKESGLGYFDGDTYVFRQGGKPVDGEDDAWLDGVGDEEEGETGAEGGVGGLDATAVWKPRPVSTTQDKRSSRKSTFVDEDATSEDLARRVVALLERGDETVMEALTRYGASLRKLQAQARQMGKRTRLKGRRLSNQQGSEKGQGSSPIAMPTSSGAMTGTKDLKRETDAAREAVEELTELADALLFGGEVDAYDQPRRVWIRRFGLERHLPLAPTKRPLAPADAAPAKKKSRGYFEDVGVNEKEGGAEKATTTEPRMMEVMWEYRGNEDGAVHGPYTSRQMWEWMSRGYFVGESAVDIRRVGGNHSELSGKESVGNGSRDDETDAEDLLADLLEGDDDGEDNSAAKESPGAHGAVSLWMRSDKVDFRSYL